MMYAGVPYRAAEPKWTPHYRYPDSSLTSLQRVRRLGGLTAPPPPSGILVVFDTKLMQFRDLELVKGNMLEIQGEEMSSSASLRLLAYKTLPLTATLGLTLRNRASCSEPYPSEQLDHGP